MAKSFAKRKVAHTQVMTPLSPSAHGGIGITPPMTPKKQPLSPTLTPPSATPTPPLKPKKGL